MTTYQTETREIDGHEYRISWIHDDTAGRPEAESDGHGVTRDIDYDPAEFGENHDAEEDGELDMEEVIRHRMMRVLSRERTRGGSYRVYDVWDTLILAKKDGWRDLKYELEHPDATEEEKRMAAVDADFAYLKGWYDNDWHWCGITITLLDDEEEDTIYDASLWGLSSDDDDDYHEEVIKDLVREIRGQVRREAEKGQTPLPL